MDRLCRWVARSRYPTHSRNSGAAASCGRSVHGAAVPVHQPRRCPCGCVRSIGLSRTAAYCVCPEGACGWTHLTGSAELLESAWVLAASPTVANDTIYVGSQDGNVYAWDAERSGEGER